MVPVVDAIVPVRPEADDPGEVTHHDVQTASTERRPVGGLVQRAEDEREHVSVNHDQGHDPTRGPETPDQRAGHRQHSEMPDRPQQRRSVGANHQALPIPTGELVGREAQERVLSHQATSSRRADRRRRRGRERCSRGR